MIAMLYDDNGKIVNYCPVVNGYCNEPAIESDTYFLIQPFDEEKQNREDVIRKALDLLYGSRKGSYPDNKAYLLKKSDEQINNTSVYCDICRKIKSSQYCIVDITGELYNIADGTTKIFLRSNVFLELGMSYGLNKPVFVLSRKIDGKREIPSDIQFIRYIDITPKHTTIIKIGNWEGATQNILNHLRETLPQVYTKTLISREPHICENIRENLDYLILVKEMSRYLKDKNLELSYITYKNSKLIGVILKSEFLKEKLLFKCCIIDAEEIENLIGYAEIFYVQQNGICQAEFKLINDTNEYTQQIITTCVSNGEKYCPLKSRLELITPKWLDSYTKEREDIIKQLIGEL